MSKYVKGSQFRNMADFANYMEDNTALYFNGKIINVAFVRNWQFGFISDRLELLRKAVKVMNFEKAFVYICINDCLEDLTIGKPYYVWKEKDEYVFFDDNNDRQTYTKRILEINFKEA